jgi:hypothetical protein
MTKFSKDPNSNLDYSYDWTSWLKGESGTDTDVLTASTWFVDGSALTIGVFTHDNYTTTVWLSAGIEGATYRVTNRITTQKGRVEDRSFLVTIKQK